jgi:hypothetical protein
MTTYINNIPVLEHSSGNGEQEFTLWTIQPSGKLTSEYGPRFKSGEVRKFCRVHGMVFTRQWFFSGYIIYAHTPAQQVHFRLMFGIKVLLASEWLQFIREEQQRQEDELNHFEAELQAHWHARRSA